MYTGGGILLNGRWCGSRTLTPSPDTNQIFPSLDLPTRGLRAPVSATNLTPSELPKTVLWIVRFGFVSHASNSGRAMRTRPQARYNQTAWSLSSIDQLTASQGSPFLLVSVETFPSLMWLSPPSVAAHSVPREPNRSALTRP